MGLESLPTRKEDFNAFERFDLLTDEPRFVEAQVRNTIFAKIAALTGLLIAILNMSFVWMLYHRDNTGTYFWTAVWMSIISGFFFLCLLWAFKASIGVKNGVQPGPNFTFLVFISSLVFIGYLLVQSIWLFVHKKIHFNFLVDFSKDETAWKLKFSNGTSLAEVWKQDNRMILWIVSLNAVLAVLLAFVAYTARSVSWNRYSLARSSLYLAQLTIAGSAWLTIFWVQEALNYRDTLPGYILGHLLTVIKVCAIIALFIAGANSLVNYFQIKIGYLVIARVQIILVIAMFIAASITFRELRNATITGLFPGGCAATQYSINEAALDSRWCAVGGKYLEVGQMGQKSELVTRWEGNNEIRTLNPACCESSNYYYIYPFMMVGFWSLICIFSTAIAAGSNLYIADTNEYLLLSNRTPKFLDVLGVSSVLFMIAAWTLYMTLKGKSSLSSNPNFAAFNDPLNNPIPGFDLVPDALKVTADSAAVASSFDCLAFNSTGECISSQAALQVADYVTLKGKLHFGPKEDKNFNIHREVTVTAYKSEEKIGEVSLLSEGTFKILGVPRYSKSRYILTLDINDPTGVFLQKKVDVLVDFAGSKDEVLSAGYIRMNTKDGNLCTPTDILCIASQKPQIGSLQISILDGSNDFSSVVSDPLSGVSNLLLRWWQIAGQTVEEITSDASGILQFSNLPFDSYTVISSKTGFRPVLTRIDLQAENQIVPSVVMRPLIDNYDMRIQAFIHEPNVDFDLHLVVESDKGTTCTVSPLNKFCAYSASMNDAAFGSGLEEIVIKKLAVATYMTYLAPSSPYKTNCLVGQAASSHLHQSHSQTWNWNEFKQTSHLSEMDINLHSFGKSVYSTDDFDQFYERASITHIFQALEHIVEKVKNDEASHMPPVPVVHEHESSNTKTWELTNINQESSKNRNSPGTMPGINGTVSANYSETYEMDNCNVKVTFLDYNNNTAKWYVNVSTTFNFTQCDNGTNFTTNSTSANFYGFDQTEAFLLNSTFRTDYQNGTSLVVVNNSNFTFPNGTFSLVNGNSSNSSVVTGVNTCINNPPSYSINVNNTNHTYNQTIIQILNQNSSNLTNSSVTYVVEFDYFNSVLDQNFSSNTSMVFYPAVNLTGNGTENSTSFKVYIFGNVTLNETCNLSNFTNGSSLIECNITNFTIFTNGTNVTIYSTKNNTFAPTSMEGTVIVQLNTNSTSTTVNRTENYSSIQVPNGTNFTLDILNISTNFSNNTTLTYNYSWSINDTNNTSTIVMNDSTLVNLTNGTSYNDTFFFNNTIVLNDSNFTIKILSNTTTNDTNEANSTFMEEDISNLTINATNFTEQVINATFKANSSSHFSNYSNFSNVTHIWNNTTSIQVFVNNSNVSNPNGTSYNDTFFFNNTIVLNDSNFTIKILSNTTTNDTNEANSTFMEEDISNLTINATNFTEQVINATFKANSSANLANYSNFSNVTHIWNNTTSIQVFINNTNVSYPNGTNLSLQNFSNVSQTLNGSNYSVTDFHVLINFSNNSSLKISDSTNSSNIGNNSSNSTNITSENYTRKQTNISGTNESFSNMTVVVSEAVPENNTNTSVTFVNSYFLNLSQNLSYSNNTTINDSLLINDTRTSFNLSTYNDSNLTSSNYSMETMNGSNNSWSFFNWINVSTAGGNNSTVVIQYNVTVFASSNDSTKNFTNSSIYNYSNFSSNTDNSSANITNVSVNLSIGSNNTNATTINTTIFWDNMSFPNGTFESTYIETKNLTSPASTNWSNVTFFNFTNLTVNAPNTTNVSLNQSITNTCLMVNASTFKSNSCNFTADYSNGTNDTNASSNDTMIVTNVTNFTNGTNFSYFLNVSNASTLNGTSPSLNQTYITLNVTVISPFFNGSNSSIFVQCYIIQNSTGTYSDCDESTLALLKQSPADLFGNLSSSAVVQGACEFFNTSKYQSEYCNLTYNYSNGTNKANATMNYTVLITNSTNFTNGSNYTYYYNLTNISLPVCMIPNTNMTFYTLNVTWRYPPSDNCGNMTIGPCNSSCANTTNSSLFIQCFVVQNATGNYSNCSNSSMAYFGLNTSFLFNSSTDMTTNTTITYSNQTYMTNFSENVSLVNSSNGSISDMITFYANLTSPVTVNGTQQNLTNTSNFTRNFAQNRSDFMKAFNESNYSFNVGVSLFNSSHEITNSKNFTKTMFLIGNSSNSTLNETLKNNSFNFTVDYRYNDTNQSYVNIYSQNFSDTITNNSSLNFSNITRNYSSSVNSSLNYNITFLGFNATNNTGYNLSAIFNSNRTFGNSSQSFYNLSSGNNNTTLNQNYTVLVINASSGDASNFSSTSTLGLNGSNLTYGNWSMNQSQPIFNGSQLVGFTTLNYTLNNVTGTYTNNSTSLSYRNYTYQLFNLSQIQPATGGNNTFNTYHYFLFDSNNVSGGINTTLTAQIDLVNSTDNSANTTYRLWDLLVCQNNGSCNEVYFQNDSFVSISGPNTTSSQNFTQNYSNNTSNVTGIDMNVSNTTNSSGLFIIQVNMSSNRTLANGSNYSIYNYSAFENISSSTLEIDGYQNVSYLLFLSPVVNGSLTGLNRSYFSTQIATYNSNSTGLINRTLVNQTTDLIWLPGGIVTVYNLTTVNISATNSSVNNTLNQQVNRSRLMPNSSAGVPYSDYNNSTVVIVYPNTTILWQSNTSNLSGFVAGSGDSASFGGYLNCSFVTNVSSTLYSNHSNITYGIVQSTCYYKNGSLEVNSTLKFLESDNGGTPYGNQNSTSSVDGVNASSTTSKCSSMRRRMLMEKPAESHKQGGSFTGSGNYIFISCFTGFGGASVININAIVDNLPDMNTCLTRINNERPQYTVQKLRQAVNNYNGAQ